MIEIPIRCDECGCVLAVYKRDAEHPHGALEFKGKHHGARHETVFDLPPPLTTESTERPLERPQT